MKNTPRAIKLRESNIKKHGSLEAWQAYQREQGAKARRDTPRGFALIDKKKAREIQSMGGKARHGKKENGEAES